MISSNQNVNYANLPDFELNYSEEELDKLSQDLSTEDEKELKEIDELEKGNDGKSDFIVWSLYSCSVLMS